MDLLCECKPRAVIPQGPDYSEATMKQRSDGTLVPDQLADLSADLGTMVINEPEPDLATMKREFAPHPHVLYVENSKTLNSLYSEVVVTRIDFHIKLSPTTVPTTTEEAAGGVTETV